MLCQLADVKDYLGITTTATDSVLTTLVNNAGAFIERYCNRVFEQASYTETRNGNGASAIFMRNVPIISVQSVSVDGTSVPAAPDAISYGYIFDSNKVYLRGDARINPVTPGIFAGYPPTFSRGIQNITIAYTAGYPTVPMDIAQACIELVASKFAKRMRIDKKSDVLAQETVSFDLSDMPASVKTTLSQWVIPMVAP